MAIIKCKMCGGDLLLVKGSTIATCEYCGTVQTVPSMDDEKKLLQFERAERLRKNCDFDKAAGIYESIVADFRYEAEAYWSLVLCKYGIEYVDDPATGKKVPTCHRSSFDSVMEDSNFEQTLENANASSRKIYREEAKQIEEIRKGIVAVSNNEQPYDIFICYKETAEDGQRTADSVMAQDIYDALTDKGYRVFFSRITLEDKLGQEYEPYIFAALNSAKVMLAIGTDYEHFNAVWVKNEWSRFLKLMEKDKSKHLIPCFKDIDAYDMPKEFSKLQAQDLGKVGAVQDLLRGIGKLIAVKPATQTTQLSGEDVQREYLYNSAVEAAKSRKLKEIKSAIEKLESLGEWKDAPAQLELARENLKRTQKATISIVLIFVFLIGCITAYFAYHSYLNKLEIYNMAQNYESKFEFESAMVHYADLGGFKDSKERLASVEQALYDEQTAILNLLRGDEHGEEYSADFRLEGRGSKVGISLTWSSPSSSTGYLAYMYPPADDSDKVEAFFKSLATYVHFDVATQEYVFVSRDKKCELYRGKLNDDGSLVLENEAGVTYKLKPYEYYKNNELVYRVK